MKLSLLFAVPALVLGLTMSPSAADDEVTIEDAVLASMPPPVTVEEKISAPQSVPLPPPLPTCVLVDCAAAVRYMRTLDPETLIRIAFDGTGATDRMLSIARRESGLGRHSGDPRAACAAKNPRSSASGLFQTLYGWNGTAVAHGLSWENIVGSDCLDDVILARKIWDRSGFGPWRL